MSTPNHLARAQILLLVAQGVTSQNELSDACDLQPMAACHHIQALRAQGLLVRPESTTWRTPVALTTEGDRVAAMLSAIQVGQPVFRRLVAEYFGTYRRSVASRVVEFAEQIDRDYAASRDGLQRDTANGRELERKTSTVAMVEAMKSANTWDACSAQVGLTSGAFRRRANALFQKVKQEA